MILPTLITNFYSLTIYAAENVGIPPSQPFKEKCPYLMV